jgi:uncharacterized protein YcbX
VAVHVARIGLAPVKGTRHVDLPSVALTAGGPVGDRVFCLVDPARGRIVRTVENRSLLSTTARWTGRELTTVLTGLPAGSVTGVPEPTGRTCTLDYWGRDAVVELVAGPWAEAYSRLLGRDVELARTTGPGEIVYGAPVSLVTTSSLDRVSAATGGVVDGAQFRATFTVDTAGEPPHVEDSWVGRRLRVGEAVVQVRAAIPRCAVVDLDPATGTRRGDVLAALAGYRRAAGEIFFGVDAVVVGPGRVEVDAGVERV